MKPHIPLQFFQCCTISWLFFTFIMHHLPTVPQQPVVPTSPQNIPTGIILQIFCCDPVSAMLASIPAFPQFQVFANLILFRIEMKKCVKTASDRFP
jgi:hypothetical protein